MCAVKSTTYLNNKSVFFLTDSGGLDAGAPAQKTHES